MEEGRLREQASGEGRGARLLTLKIIFYLYHYCDKALVSHIIEDIRESERAIRAALWRLKRNGIVVHEDKRYYLSPEFRNMLDNIVKASTKRRMGQVNPGEVIP